MTCVCHQKKCDNKTEERITMEFFFFSVQGLLNGDNLKGKIKLAAEFLFKFMVFCLEHQMLGEDPVIKSLVLMY